VRFVCVVAGVFCLAGVATARPWQAPPAYRTTTKKNQTPDSSEERECRECHAQEVEGFARSKMAQSMRLPAEEPPGIVQLPGTRLARLFF
jgi:hypothetical protein